MKTNKGFMLIELLVVISILVLLMAVLLPCVQRVRRLAKAAGCQANLRQWGLLYNTSLAENDGQMFLGFSWQENPRYIGEYNWWVSLQQGYGPQARELLFCPMAPRPDPTQVKEPGTGLRSGGPGSTFYAWWVIEREGPVVAASYTMNYLGLLAAFRPIAPGDNPPAPGRLWGAPQTSIPVMLDGCWWHAYLCHQDPPPAHENCQQTLSGCFCINRHDAFVNSLFLDWSVRKVGLKELWTLNWYSWFNARGPWTKAGGVQPEDWPQWMRGFKDY